MAQSLEALVADKLGRFDPEGIRPFLLHLQGLIGDRAEAIVVYGSCLSEVTRSGSSTPDFYLLVNRYRALHASPLHAALNWILPPSIYHFVVGGKQAKYNVISLKDLKRETSLAASDVYHLGRFSKRIAVAWVKNREVLEEIARIQASAMRTVAQKTYSLMPNRFTLDDFVKKCLHLSYIGDVRVEAENKIDRLWEAEKEHYAGAYGLILDEMKQAPRLLKQNLTTGTYEKTDRGFADRLEKTRLGFFLSQSRLRAQLRWPKGIFTVDGWVDYMLQKIERTQGIKIEMTPLQKRLWFIYGWKYFFSLRRKKLIK